MRFFTCECSTALVAGLLASCSLGLDFDKLQAGAAQESTDDDNSIPCDVPADCDDGIACTTDTCDNKRCAFLPDNDLCPYLQMCSREKGCVETGRQCYIPGDCDDKIDCTVESCVAGKCRITPTDARCESADLCLIGEKCLVENGCTKGLKKSCDQSVAGPCAKALCDSASGECVELVDSHADDDSDGSLDADCGGDDCNDGDATIHPQAAERCNYRDDDCDGFSDLAMNARPAIIAETAELSHASLAFDGQQFALVWQRGSGADSAVMLLLLDAAGKQVTSSINFTTKAAGASSGTMPKVSAAKDGFQVAWIAEAGGKPLLALLGFRLDEAGEGVDMDKSAVVLSAGAPEQIGSPALAFDEGGDGWVVAFAASYADKTTSVELVSQDLFEASLPAFALSVGSEAVQGLSLCVQGPRDYGIAWTKADVASDGDIEVFASRVGRAGDAYVHGAGYPARLSPANATVADPSLGPVCAPSTSDSWAVVFSDVRVDELGAPEGESDLRAWREDAGFSDVVKDPVLEQQDARLAFTGEDYGVLYANVSKTVATLDFKVANSNLSPWANQGGRLVEVASGELEVGDLISSGSRFGATWIVRSTSKPDQLFFAAFDGCSP